MAKWCVCNITGSPKRVHLSYEAEENQQSKYGGPWGNSQQFQHIRVPEELEAENPQNLVPHWCDLPAGTKKVPVEKIAYDSEGDPVLDEDGDPIIVIDYEDQEVMAPGWTLKKKSS